MSFINILIYCNIATIFFYSINCLCVLFIYCCKLKFQIKYKVLNINYIIHFSVI